MRRTVDPPATGEAHLAAPVSTVASRQVLWTAAEAAVAEAARCMHEADVDSILVRSLEPAAATVGTRATAPTTAGIVTDRDLRRILAQGIDPATPVGEIASRPLLTLAATAPVADAHLAMLAADVHHLALVEDADGTDGRVTGVVSRADLHRHQSRGPLVLVHHIDRAEPNDRLRSYAAHRQDAVRSLRRGGVSAATAGRIASHLDDHLVRRCLRIESERLEAERGPLATPWAWVAFGSDGRREQPMLIDQHNALVFDPSELDRDAGAAASETFHLLATRVGERLRTSGLPDASGGFVAHRWCTTAAEWRRRFRHWLEEPDPESLEHAQVFFDLRRVAGDLDVGLASTWRDVEPPVEFLRLLSEMAVRRRPAARRWRGLVRDGAGEVDLVEGGLRPLVALARVAGVAAGLVAGTDDTSCSTPDRLDRAGRLGLLSRADTDRLLEVHGWLADRSLDLQLARAHDGASPSARVRPAELGRRDRRRLASDLRFVRRQQAGLDAAVRRFQKASLGAAR